MTVSNQPTSRRQRQFEASSFFNYLNPLCMAATLQQTYADGEIHNPIKANHPKGWDAKLLA